MANDLNLEPLGVAVVAHQDALDQPLQSQLLKIHDRSRSRLDERRDYSDWPTDLQYAVPRPASNTDGGCAALWRDCPPAESSPRGSLRATSRCKRTRYLLCAWRGSWRFAPTPPDGCGLPTSGRRARRQARRVRPADESPWSGR